MTWYEVLEAPPAAAARRPMAAHLLRWWKTKFSAGYKHFSVLAEGERTDTEELVGRAPSQCSAPPDLLPSEARALLAPEASTTPAATPPPATPRPATPPPHADRLHFEEFTCDVQVCGGKSPGGTQPLHFSFTLYDFDGHGRITKDDIAGIVSTIYESFGKNVTVPHYGSKTIQVRLTVSPDQRKTVENESPQPISSNVAKGDHKVRFKRDLNSHVREGRRKPRRKQPESIPLVSQPQPLPSIARAPEIEHAIIASDPAEEERRSRLSIDDDVSECSDRLKTPKSFKRNIRQRQYQKNNLSPRYRNQQNNLSHHRNDIWNSQKENVLPSHGCVSSPEQLSVQKDSVSVDGSRAHGSTDKKRSGSLQRRELLEIIQANMEKNHLSFQTSRKHYPEQRIISSLEGDSVNSKNRHRNRSNTFTAKHTPDPINHSSFSDHHNNGYLDLASTNVNTHKESNICRYDSFLHAVICSSSQHGKTGPHPKGQATTPAQQQKPWKSHHRSRSHDLAQGPFRYTLLEPYETMTSDNIQDPVKNVETRAKSFDYCREQEIMHRLNVTTESKTKHLNRSESKPKSYDLEQNVELIRKANVNRKPTVHSHACSPHHLKHQNREKYHARAMAQVEKWLENDNNTRLMKSSTKKKWNEQECKVGEKVDNLTANLDINDSLEWKGLLRGSEADGEGEDSNGTSTVHRYVHEHIHHHYHHFEDKLPSTNAVVV